MNRIPFPDAVKTLQEVEKACWKTNDVDSYQILAESITWKLVWCDLEDGPLPSVLLEINVFINHARGGKPLRILRTRFLEKLQRWLNVLLLFILDMRKQVSRMFLCFDASSHAGLLIYQKNWLSLLAGAFGTHTVNWNTCLQQTCKTFITSRQCTIAFFD